MHSGKRYRVIHHDGENEARNNNQNTFLMVLSGVGVSPMIRDIIYLDLISKQANELSRLRCTAAERLWLLTLCSLPTPFCLPFCLQSEIQYLAPDKNAMSYLY
jgi:hypothetical protein